MKTPKAVPQAEATRKEMLSRYSNDMAEIDKLELERDNAIKNFLSEPNEEKREFYYAQAKEAELKQGLVSTRAIENARKMLYVNDPSSVTLTRGGKLSSSVVQTGREGLDLFNQMVSRTLTEGLSASFKETKKSRAFYSGSVTINSKSSVRTVIHELGHWLEDKNPQLFASVNKFFERRTKGDKLRWLGGNYSKSEVAYFDDFIIPYMGKDYVFKGERYATEITSMGLQFFYEDPVRLAKEDPDYFDFIYNLVRGN
jgi:hypothetical protein